MKITLINSLNVLALVFITIALINLVQAYFRDSSRKETYTFFMLALGILLLVVFTNVLEHFNISSYFDLYEDLLELLFIPFVIFAVYTSTIKKEFDKRLKAEYFSSKILDTSPAITFIYNLTSEEFSFISGSFIGTGNEEKSSRHNHEAQTYIQEVLDDANLKTLQSYLQGFKMKASEDSMNSGQLALTDENGKRIYYQTYETIFSSDEFGAPIELVGVAIDITDKKKADIELIKYQDHLEDLVKSRTIDLETTNNELKSINNKLFKTNEELRSLNELAEQQATRIESLNDSLILKNEALEQSNKELKVKQEELESALNRLNEMQSQLIQSEKLSSVGVLMAGIAHEINNPINYISNGMLGLKKAVSEIEAFVKTVLEQNAEGGKQVSGNLTQLIEEHELQINVDAITVISGHILTGTNRILDIISSLRQYTRSGDQGFEPCDLHVIIESVLVMLSHEYKHRIQIQKNFQELPLVYCQSGKINQVIMNIISNAIQAIPDNGTIKIETRRHDNKGNVSITIFNTNSHIPDDVQKKIFDPFFTTKPTGKGTGLGLSISYDIIQAHRGTLTCISTKQKGTTFIITLPISTAKMKEV